MLGSRIVAAAALGTVALAFGGCGAKHPPPVDVEETGGTAGSGPGVTAGQTGSTHGGAAGGTAVGASGSSTGGVDGGGANSGGTGGGGTGGQATIIECGNDVAEAGEECDGDDLGGHTCRSGGFDEGTLRCRGCQLDFVNCSGTESCFDFRDNDGDRTIDCDDSDCSAACSAPCEHVPELADPAIVEGSLTGRTTGALGPSCSAGGPELVYQLTAAHTGVLEASVTGSDAITISLRTQCDDATSELRCAYGSHLKPTITEGDTVFVVVAGLTEDDVGRFTLEVASRRIRCGDGYRDDEECDDGNQTDDDGCSSTCQLESSESSNNDDLSHADSYTEPFFGSIAAAEDEDWVEFSVGSTPGAVAIDTFDLGDGACARKELDSLVELYDDAGQLVVSADGVEAIDDDSGVGYCASLVLGDLPAGSYYVRVLASPAGQTRSFPYRLSLDVDACGNGRQAEAEECDDGNRIDWDGCDANCKLE